MDTNPRVLIIESLTLFRAGLCAMLAQIPRLDIVAALDDGIDAFSLVAELDPQLVLVGTSLLMIAVELIRKIKRAYPDIRVLAISSCEPETSILDSLRAGADGYVLKDATREEFCTAIRCALSGKTCSTPNMSINALKGHQELHGPLDAMTISDTLTPREREVLILAANGNSNKSIARCLSLSINTVEKHRGSLMKKLDLHNVAALTLYAITKGWISASRPPRGGPNGAHGYVVFPAT